MTAPGGRCQLFDSILLCIAFIGWTVYLLGINQPRALNPQIPLQPQQHEWDNLATIEPVVPPRDLPPEFLRVHQASAIADVVAKDDKIGG